MRVKRQLVTEYLEKVSWEVLDEYRALIKDMIRGKSGVYALYRGERLYYVGLASNLMARLNRHLKDRHADEWDCFSVYLTVHDEHIKELESLLLRIVSPPGNKVSGKFTKQSNNLRRRLNASIKEYHADRRAAVLGGNIARQRQRKKRAAGTGRGQTAVGLVSSPVRLKGSRKSYEYRASLRKDGIRYRNYIYENPTEAARATLPASKQRVNGWTFWHYRDAKTGEWVKLRNLKS